MWGDFIIAGEIKIAYRAFVTGGAFGLDATSCRDAGKRSPEISKDIRVKSTIKLKMSTDINH